MWYIISSIILILLLSYQFTCLCASALCLCDITDQAKNSKDCCSCEDYLNDLPLGFTICEDFSDKSFFWKKSSLVDTNVYYHSTNCLKIELNLFSKGSLRLSPLKYSHHFNRPPAHLLFQCFLI